MNEADNEITIPDEMKYTGDHQWINMIDDITGICGVTEYLQHGLGEIILVEYINNILHADVEDGEKIAIIESLDDSIDLCSILPGKIIEINRSLEDNPEIINTDCYNDGWIYKIEVEDATLLENLLEPDDYMEIISSDNL